MRNNHLKRHGHRGHYHSRPGGNLTSASARALSGRMAVVQMWPALLSIDQVGVYLEMHPDTFLRHAPVSPVKLGARLLRWRRADIDRWLDGVHAQADAATTMISPLPDTTAQAIHRVLERSKRTKVN